MKINSFFLFENFNIIIIIEFLFHDWSYINYEIKIQKYYI